MSVVVLDDNGNEVTGWRPSINPASVSVAPGEATAVQVKLNPKENVNRGPYSVVVSLTAEGEVLTTFSLQASSSPAEGNKGLFNIVPWYVSVAIVASLILIGVVVSRKIKNSGSVENDDAQLVTAEAYGVLPDAGSRREKALDIGMSQDDKTSGEVSQEEIAAALAKSMADQFSLPPSANPLPQAGLPPLGMPPSGMPPAGLPPVPGIGRVPMGMPPASPQMNIPAPLPPQPKPTPEVRPVTQTTGPPLPATGLPSGWTMDQWNAYGHMWLEKNQP